MDERDLTRRRGGEDTDLQGACISRAVGSDGFRRIRAGAANRVTKVTSQDLSHIKIMFSSLRSPEA